MVTARILDLEGKYYGTTVLIEGDGEIDKCWIEAVINDRASDEPSERQKKDWGYSKEEWEALSAEQLREFTSYDSHWETESDYEMAEFVRDSINFSMQMRCKK
jgi:hypothetical protein